MKFLFFPEIGASSYGELKLTWVSGRRIQNNISVHHIRMAVSDFCTVKKIFIPFDE